jgi:hypothetical protein
MNECELTIVKDAGVQEQEVVNNCNFLVKHVMITYKRLSSFTVYEPKNHGLILLHLKYHKAE